MNRASTIPHELANELEHRTGYAVEVYSEVNSLDLNQPIFSPPNQSSMQALIPLGTAYGDLSQIGGRMAGSEISYSFSQTALEAVSQGQRMVPVDSVIRGASCFSAAISIMSILATILSGAIIIQPALAVMILIVASGFYFMTTLKK
jgi:hypothetical protein